MSLGTILVSVAVLVGVGAYVASPFRRTDASSSDADVDRLVEAWLRRAQLAAISAAAVQPTTNATELPAGPAVAPRAGAQMASVSADRGEPVGNDEPVDFCPYCGRQVEPDHAFCPKCGRQLFKGDPK